MKIEAAPPDANPVDCKGQHIRDRPRIYGIYFAKEGLSSSHPIQRICHKMEINKKDKENVGFRFGLTKHPPRMNIL